MKLTRTIVAAGVIAASTSAFAAEKITGAGATFPYPIYSKWADAYKKETGNELNYQSVGSGAGIAQIRSKTLTFGATDMPLEPAQLEKDGLVQWPMVMGAIVPVVNIQGIKPGELTFDAETLANIFLGKITKWDDPAIKKLNPKVSLSSAAIIVVHRSDGSGTTFNFTDYLSKASSDWKTKVGSGTTVEWPAGVGAKGNEGVSANVGQQINSIGYVEYAYTKLSQPALFSVSLVLCQRLVGQFALRTFKRAQIGTNNAALDTDQHHANFALGAARSLDHAMGFRHVMHSSWVRRERNTLSHR
jgi:phosphate transport system substrate-binding protein